MERVREVWETQGWVEWLRSPVEEEWDQAHPYELESVYRRRGEHQGVKRMASRWGAELLG